MLTHVQRARGDSNDKNIFQSKYDLKPGERRALWHKRPTANDSRCGAARVDVRVGSGNTAREWATRPVATDTVSVNQGRDPIKQLSEKGNRIRLNIHCHILMHQQYWKEFFMKK
jgi:hypothetical protein